MFKKGDRVKDVTVCDSTGVVADINPEGELSIHWDGEFYDPADTVYWDASDFALVTEGPVRTVTVIVEGDYGPVMVTPAQILVLIDRDHASADKLREAIATLQTLLGALE